MVTTGTYNTVQNYNFTESIDEAFRRCKLDPASLTAEHAISARYSINLMFIDWANDPVQQFLMSTQTQALVGDGVTDISFVMPVGGIDVLSMVFVDYQGTVIQIKAISRQDYLYLNDRTIQGQPICYWVDKSAIQPTVFLWPVQNYAGCSVQYTMLSQIQDAGRGLNTPNISVLYYEAFISGLAAKLAEKYCATDLEDRLLAKYLAAYTKATDQDRDRSALVIKPRLGRRYYYGI